MNKVYLVLERESPEDYDVVFITMDEKMAKDISGEDLLHSILIAIERCYRVPKSKIACSPRIGISKAKEQEWRFSIKGNSWVSSYSAKNKKRKG